MQEEIICTNRKAEGFISVCIYNIILFANEIWVTQLFT